MGSPLSTINYQLPIFDLRTIFFNTVCFREVIVENVIFSDFFSMKFRFFDNNFPKIKCVTKGSSEIKNGPNFRRFDTLITFWGAFKKKFDDDWVSY